MHRFLLVLIVVIGGAACQVDEPGEVNLNEPRIAVDAGIVVTDIAQSLTFYRDVLGLPVIAEVRTSLIGQGQMVQLQHGKSLIKLVQMDEAPTTGSPVGLTAAFGLRYITLMTTDIDAIMEKIERAKAPVALPLTELGNGAKILMAQDPDGNIVEFVQEAES